jgi:hypothetical protein
VRDKRKLRLIQTMNDAMEGTLPRHADWKAAAWLLEKGWPLEFAPYERRPIPVEPVAPKSVPDLSGSFLMSSVWGMVDTWTLTR